ncbi:MAG TPA: hypothetical protein PKM25_15160, partial [Candidatus Ozemobacteraceae bacterium]|nr:hypothetical protein [Candidatus Ozemobacteraceae bacterium]
EPETTIDPQPLEILDSVAGSAPDPEMQPLEALGSIAEPGPELPASFDVQDERGLNGIPGATQTPGELPIIAPDEGLVRNSMEALTWPSLEPAISESGLPDLAIPVAGADTPADLAPEVGFSASEAAEVSETPENSEISGPVGESVADDAGLFADLDAVAPRPEPLLNIDYASAEEHGRSDMFGDLPQPQPGVSALPESPEPQD